MSNTHQIQPLARINKLRQLVGSGGAYLMARKIWLRMRLRLLPLARPATTWRRHRALKGKTVVIYTMGKVGSSSVFATLMKSFPFRHIFHTHFLSEEWIVWRLPGTAFARNIPRGKSVLRALGKKDREVLYITLMRDPVARDLSNLIQNHVEKQIDIGNLSLDQVCDAMRNESHMFFQEWFDTEFAAHTGQKVETVPFDRSRGYAIHDLGKNRRILLLTVESMDRVFDEALSTFLGIDVDGQVRFNESDSKAEAAFYKQVKTCYRLSDAELDAIYNAPSCRHFYDKAHLANMRSKWLE